MLHIYLHTYIGPPSASVSISSGDVSQTSASTASTTVPDKIGNFNLNPAYHSGILEQMNITWSEVSVSHSSFPDCVAKLMGLYQFFI